MKGLVSFQCRVIDGNQDIHTYTLKINGESEILSVFCEPGCYNRSRLFLILAPKGRRASMASLKCCNPEGYADDRQAAQQAGNGPEQGQDYSSE